MFSTQAHNKTEHSNAKSHNYCSSQPKKKSNCPLCHYTAKGVLSKTLKHLLMPDTKSNLNTLEGFYYCKNPSCEVIYFKEEILLKQKDLSVIVGLKKGATPATLCYCFNWTQEQIKNEVKVTGHTTVLDDIKAKIKDQGCKCEILNPSGQCCLVDVKEAMK